MSLLQVKQLWEKHFSQHKMIHDTLGVGDIHPSPLFSTCSAIIEHLGALSRVTYIQADKKRTAKLFLTRIIKPVKQVNVKTLSEEM